MRSDTLPLLFGEELAEIVYPQENPIFGHCYYSAYFPLLNFPDIQQTAESFLFVRTLYCWLCKQGMPQERYKIMGQRHCSL